MRFDALVLVCVLFGGLVIVRVVFPVCGLCDCRFVYYIEIRGIVQSWGDEGFVLVWVSE